MRFVGRSLIGLFLLSLTAGLLAMTGIMISESLSERLSRDTQPRPQRERVFAAQVVTLTPVTVQPRLQVIGEVASRRTLELRASSAGRIVFLDPAMVDGGQVTKGQLLMELDPADATSALSLAQADLHDATAEIADATKALELARDDLEGAQAAKKLRDQALQRQRDLVARGVGTDAAVETAELAASAAEQSVLQKRQALVQAQARAEKAQTTLARRQVALEDADRKLADTKLYAAFDGALSGVSVVEGGLLSKNERVALLVDPAALDVKFRLSNAQYAHLLDGAGKLVAADVTVALDLLGASITASGQITRVSATVEAGQSGRQVFAALTDGDLGAFQPGDFVSVTIREPAMNGVAEIPARAVDSAGNVLTVRADDRLAEAQVQVLRHQSDTVIVRPGAAAGQEIVAARSPLLGAGVKIKPLRDGVAAPQTPDKIALDDDRRARLVAFVQSNDRIPADRKTRILQVLQEQQVPTRLVERLESRIGG